MFTFEVPEVDFGFAVVCEVFVVWMQIPTSLTMKQPYEGAAHYKLIICVFIIIPVNLYLKLSLGPTQINFTLWNIMIRWISSINWLGSDFVDSFLQMLWIGTLKAFNFQKTFGDVEVHGLLFAALEDYLVIVMNSISFLLVLEPTKSFKMCALWPIFSQVDFIAGVVFICAYLGSLQEALARNMKKLDYLTIVNNLPNFLFHAQIILFYFIGQLLFENLDFLLVYFHVLSLLSADICAACIRISSFSGVSSN